MLIIRKDWTTVVESQPRIIYLSLVSHLWLRLIYWNVRVNQEIKFGALN